MGKTFKTALSGPFARRNRHSDADAISRKLDGARPRDVARLYGSPRVWL